MADITTNKMGFYKDGNWYIVDNDAVELPVELFFSSGYSSSEISNFVGGTSGFGEIVKGVTDGKTVHVVNDGFFDETRFSGGYLNAVTAVVSSINNQLHLFVVATILNPNFPSNPMLNFIGLRIIYNISSNTFSMGLFNPVINN